MSQQMILDSDLESQIRCKLFAASMCYIVEKNKHHIYKHNIFFEVIEAYERIADWMEIKRFTYPISGNFRRYSNIPSLNIDCSPKLEVIRDFWYKCINFDYTEQEMIWKLISESSTFRIPPS